MTKVKNTTQPTSREKTQELPEKREKTHEKPEECLRVAVWGLRRAAEALSAHQEPLMPDEDQLRALRWTSKQFANAIKELEDSAAFDWKETFTKLLRVTAWGLSKVAWPDEPEEGKE